MHVFGLWEETGGNLLKHRENMQKDVLAVRWQDLQLNQHSSLLLLSSSFMFSLFLADILSPLCGECVKHCKGLVLRLDPTRHLS
ncbi:hypothetical protein EXN66_Car000169 [Channa argus]|uniref:Uncharacterized protein n=1 Tax=Channa argus TaxID=215402 RepID=A0A6G1QWY6_CHAAH|nr:hypothetical protein EXN66_Car000169 [Channa argus]